MGLERDLILSIKILMSSLKQKPKPSSLAYARLGKTSSKSHLEDHQPHTNNTNPNQYTDSIYSNALYHTLVNDIDQEHSSYMKLLAKECSNRKNQSHLRAKNVRTVANSPRKSLSPGDSRGIPCDHLQPTSITPKASTTSLKHTHRFFSKLEKQHKEMQNSVREDAYEDDFLGFLDNYVQRLSHSSSQGCQDKESSQKLMNKLAESEGKLKEMDFVYQTRLKKFQDRERAMKNKMEEMNEQVLEMTIRLKHEYEEKRRFERLFLQCQKEARLTQKKEVVKNMNTFSFSPNSKELNLDLSMVSDSFEEQDIGELMGSSPVQKQGRESEELKTSEKISRFFRKPKELRSTNPGLSVAGEQDDY